MEPRPQRTRRTKRKNRRSKSSKKRKTGRRVTKPRAVASAPSGKVAHANDRTFGSLVLEADRPVLVDFWAEWCGPCKAVAPILDELAQEVGESARIVKVNVDSSPSTAGQFGIRSIPTMVLFKGGEVADVLVGLQSKAKLSRLLARAAR